MDLSICKLCKVHPSGQIIPDKEYTCSMEQWCWPIVYNYSIAVYRCLFLRNIIVEQNLFFTNGRKTGEDQEFTYKYMMHVSKINYVPDACYYYRLNPVSRMFKKDYGLFDAVSAMQEVERYAGLNCANDKAQIISFALRNYKYPYLLEFGIFSMLSAGEKSKVLYKYLVVNKFDVLLNNACQAFPHYNSSFMQLWSLSPRLCLKIFSIRKNVGRVLRLMKLRK